jgi:hypothetical protein
MMPYAEKASKALGGKIPPVAILGQWAGESSNGKSVSAPFNYAGIKAGKNDKKGDYVLTEEFYTNAQLERAKASGESFERVVELGDKIKKKGKDVDAWDFYGGPGKGSVLYQQKKAEGKQMVQVRSYFAKFDNPEEFTDRYVQFLSAPRYAKARESTTPAQFGLEVAKAGYATASSDKYSAGISDYAKNYSSLIKATPTSTPFTGSQLDQASKENKDMKSAAEVKNQTNVNNTNITTSQNASKQVVQQEEVDDRRPIDRKT